SAMSPGGGFDRLMSIVCERPIHVSQSGEFRMRPHRQQVRRTKVRRHLLGCEALEGKLLLSGNPRVVTVTSVADYSSTPVPHTLRWADAQVKAGQADEIDVQLAKGAVIDLSPGGPITFTKPVTLKGNGVTIEGSSANPIIVNQGTQVEIDG